MAPKRSNLAIYRRDIGRSNIPSVYAQPRNEALDSRSIDFTNPMGGICSINGG